MPAGQRCSVAGFDIGAFYDPHVRVTGCAGEVHLEDVSGALTILITAGAFEVTHSSHVTLVRCSALGLFGLSCTASTVVVADSLLEGRGYYEALGGPGISADNSRITLAGSIVRGADTNSCCSSARPPQPGIRATGSSLFLTGSRTRILGGTFPVPCVCNTPEVGVVADATTTLFVGNPIPFSSRGGILVGRTLPSLSAAPMASPGTVTLRLEGPGNALFATLASSPNGPLVHAFGDVWLDLASPLVLDAGVLAGKPGSTSNRSHPSCPPDWCWPGSRCCSTPATCGSPRRRSRYSNRNRPAVWTASANCRHSPS